jgi:hypothetical protein
MASHHPDAPFVPNIDVDAVEYQSVSAVSTPHFYRVLLSSPSGQASPNASAPTAAVIRGSGSVSPLQMSMPGANSSTHVSAQRRLVFGSENTENMSRKMNAKSAPFVPQRSAGALVYSFFCRFVLLVLFAVAHVALR